jgi:hypothetical protein
MEGVLLWFEVAWDKSAATVGIVDTPEVLAPFASQALL